MFRNQIFILIALVALGFCRQANGEAYYSSPSVISDGRPVEQTDSRFIFSSDPENASATPSLDELAKRLESLETTSTQVAKGLKDLEDAKKKAEADKKKLPNVTANGVFQADAVAFNQSDASR